jgi:hypothetical protein
MKTQGSRDDTYRNNNIDSSRGVQRGPYGGTSEDNHGPQHSTASTSEDQNNLNKHPVPAKVDQKNRTTTERENANTGKHQYLDGLQKTGGSSENNLKDTTKSVSSVVEPSKETNRKVLPIRLPDPPRSHKATTSTTPAEIQVIQFLLILLLLFACFAHSFSSCFLLHKVLFLISTFTNNMSYCKLAHRFCHALLIWFVETLF